jgi:hypothetical protein
MINKFIILFLFLTLTNCVGPGTALLGPSITVARTGSLYQAGLSYGSSHVIKKTKESLQKIKETKKIAYQRVDRLHKIIKNNTNKVVLNSHADLFFRAVKNNLKNYN